MLQDLLLKQKRLSRAGSAIPGLDISNYLILDDPYI